MTGILQICIARAQLLAAAFLAVASAGTAVANDTMIATPKKWGDPTLWQSGTVPDGAGVVVDTGDGTREVRMDGTNRVVGGITSTAGKMPASGGRFELSNRLSSTLTYGGETPQKVDGKSFELPLDTSLTFDNNGLSAFISIDDGGTSDSKRNPYRYLLDVPVILKDNLEITSQFAGTNAYGCYETGINVGPLWTVGFSGPVSGAGGITIDCAAPLYTVAFIGNDNAFTGDILVRSGVLRAHDTIGLPRTGTPFGVGNTITAVTGTGRVDLGGFRTGAGQKLVLQGELPAGDGKRGVLFSSWGRPGDFAAWEGEIELTGDTRIGGVIAGASYPCNFYPCDTPGAIEISGPISEKSAGAALTIDNDPISSPTVFTPVLLSGTNTFSGGLHLASGTLIARGGKALGTGGIAFDGGVYRYDSDESPDIFTADLLSGKSYPMVEVTEGQTATMHANLVTKLGATSFAKFGAGTLVVTNYVNTGDVFLYGTIVFDTTLSEYAKFGGSISWAYAYARFYDNARVIVRGNPDVVRHGGWYGEISHGGGVTCRAEMNQHFNIFSNTDDTLLGYGNLETDGSDAYFTINKSVNTHTYPDNCSFFVWDRRSWVYFVNGKVAPVPDDLYVTGWTACANKLVDVTPAVASAGSVPAGTTADCIRFDRPNGGKEIVLTLAGDLTLAGHTILVTPDVGSSPVRITGGAIKSTGLIRILNFNTNATLTIESDLAPVSSGTKLASCGPGTTILKGDKSLDDYIYVVGGRLLADRANAFGKGNRTWNSGYVYLTCDGAIGPAPGAKFNPEVDSTNGRTEFTLQIANKRAPSGFGIYTPADSEFIISKRTLPVTSQLFKEGPGTLTCTNSGNSVILSWLDIREGTVAATKFPESVGRLRTSDGVVLKGTPTNGGMWLVAYQTTANGGGSDSDGEAKRPLEVNGHVTVDMNASVTLNRAANYGCLQTATEYFTGDGELEIINSAGTSATLYAHNYRDATFTGTLTPHVPVEGRGLQLRTATLNLPSDGSFYSPQNSDTRRSVRFARLTGSGSFRIWNTQTTLPSYVWLGADGVADADFEGTLLLEEGASNCGAPQLVKIGTNSQRISGASNRADGNFVVRNGGLLAGNDSPATAQTGGAFGNAMIFVGDGETPADGAPAFLIDGAYAVSNEVRVAGTSPATACPTVGGTAEADGAVFGGALVFYRDAAVHAEEGTTVTFSGGFEANGYALTKTGGGTVSLAMTTAPTLNIEAGQIVVPGDLSVPVGTPLTIDTSFCTKKNRNKQYVLLSAGGTITGEFDVTNELPDRWRVMQRAHEIVLCYPSGFVVIMN